MDITILLFEEKIKIKIKEIQDNLKIIIKMKVG